MGPLRLFFIMGIALSFNIYVIAQDQSNAIFPITAEQLEKLRKMFNFPSSVLTPTEEPFKYEDFKSDYGLLSFLIILIQAVDSYLSNGKLNELTFKLYSTGGLSKLGLIRLLEGLQVFINKTDYTYVHGGLEVRLIECLESLNL